MGKVKMLAFARSLIGLVVISGVKSAPKLIRDGAAKLATWMAREWLRRHGYAEEPAGAEASSEAVKRFEVGTLVRVVAGEHAGTVGRVRFDDEQTFADGKRRVITIMVDDPMRMAIIVAPELVVAEEEVPSSGARANGGGDGGGSDEVVAEESSPWTAMLQAAIRAALKVDLSGLAAEEEAQVLVFVGPDISEVGACANELQRLLEAHPDVGWCYAGQIKYTAGFFVHRRHKDGRSVCIRVALPEMWASLTTGASLAFFGFSDAAKNHLMGERNGEGLHLALKSCRQRLVPGGVEWGIVGRFIEAPTPETVEVVAAVVGGVEPQADQVTAGEPAGAVVELAVEDFVRVADGHPYHAGAIGKITGFANHGAAINIDCSNGGPLKVITVDRWYASKCEPPASSAPAPTAKPSLRRFRKN